VAVTINAKKDLRYHRDRRGVHANYEKCDMLWRSIHLILSWSFVHPQSTCWGRWTETQPWYIRQFIWALTNIGLLSDLSRRNPSKNQCK